MVDARDIAVQPGPGRRRQPGFDLLRRAAKVQNPQTVVDIGGQGPDHFSDPALRDAAIGFHLPEPEMGVHEAERKRRVAVVLGLDERDLVAVPVNGDASCQG